MAGSAVMQSVLGSSLACAVPNRISKAKTHYFLPTLHFPRIGKNINTPLRVRCMAEDVDDQKERSTPVTNSPPPPQPKPPQPPKVSTRFSDVFAFSGPAPERINGRLAMVGFVAAMAVEVLNGQDVFAQIGNGGISWFLGTSILLSLASLVPLLKGITVESKSSGVMTSDAELWNGRFAMLGLVALAFTEYVKGGALV